MITLHGLGRSRDHMDSIGQYLEKQGGFTWINVSYASTRRSLDDHAQTLARVIQGLEGIDEINFVAHSLGNLVIRRYLGEAAQLNPRWTPDPRIKRMVMLGPPNNGAQVAGVIAEVLNDNEIARIVTGPSPWQLAREWESTQKLLGTPAFEFGVIAGGMGDGNGLNPLLSGDDDFVVRVEDCGLAALVRRALKPALTPGQQATEVSGSSARSLICGNEGAGTRTRNLGIKSPLLYQLSYAPVNPAGSIPTRPGPREPAPQKIV